MMNRTALVTGVAALAMITLAPLAAHGQTITEVLANQNSQYVQMFDGGQLDNGGTPARWTHIASAGGTSIYDYNASATPEGFVNFTSGTNGDWDIATFDLFRVRMSRDKTTAGDNVQIFPTPIGPAGNVTVADGASTQLHEVLFDLLTTPLANGNGFRIDPWNYTNDASPDRFEIDYVIADRGATLGNEFDHNGDFGGQQGVTWSVNNGTGGVSGGSLSGTSNTNDTQLNVSAGASINPNTYTFLEFRLSVSDTGLADPEGSFFWADNSGGFGANQFQFDVIDDGAFHTYLVDLSTAADWGDGTVTDFRFDPVDNANGYSYSLDYLRFYQNAVTVPVVSDVPAPAALPAGLALMLAIGARRRRK